MHSRLLGAIGLTLILSLLVLGPALGPLTSTATARDNRDNDDNDGEIVLTTRLSGEKEVPGPGDPQGRGKATITVNPDAGTICYQLSVENLTAYPADAHIHLAPAGYSGPVVVRLTPPPATTGTSSGCATVADVPGATVPWPTIPTDLAGLAAAISARPRVFYVNVHTTAFPLGAVRGQLRRG